MLLWLSWGSCTWMSSTQCIQINTDFKQCWSVCRFIQMFWVWALKFWNSTCRQSVISAGFVSSVENMTDATWQATDFCSEKKTKKLWSAAGSSASVELLNSHAAADERRPPQHVQALWEAKVLNEKLFSSSTSCPSLCSVIKKSCCRSVGNPLLWALLRTCYWLINYH